MRSIVHAIRNHLAVAVANVEAFRDGVLEPTPARMGAILRALGEVDVLLRELPNGAGAVPMPSSDPAKRRTVDLGDVVVNEVLAFEPLAHEKGVHFHLRERVGVEPAQPAREPDPVRAAEMIDAVLSNAIRHAPSGGRLEVDCARNEAVLRVTVDGAPERPLRADAFDVSQLREAIESQGGSLDVQGLEGFATRFTVRLA